MDFLRNHWYDIGGVLGIITLILLFALKNEISVYQQLMWFSLISLFLHQLEEYRVVGTFPGMINKVMFHSGTPDRFPLNSNTSLIVNVFIGWVTYILAAIVGEHAVWLGMATILVSLGNIIAHTILFNIKGKTLYNAGLATCWLLFAPCVFLFFYVVSIWNLASTTDYLIGILLGIAINVFGVFKPITWLANKDTSYIFKNRQLLPIDRKS